MKLLLLGATGLVGGEVLALALSHPKIQQVIAPTRRPLGKDHPKLLNPVIDDFANLPKDADWWGVDAVICCLGTTLKKAGSKENFKHVDYVYTLQTAQIAQVHQVQTYVLNSAVGANIASPFFYNKVKGQIENALKSVGFSSLTFVRPALIKGKRSEKRLMEGIGLALIEALTPIIPLKYRLNPASKIAKKLLDASISAPKGVHIIPSQEMI